MWCSISGETAAAKGGQLGGWPKEAARGKCLRLKRFEQIFIDILTKFPGFKRGGGGVGWLSGAKGISLGSISTSQK